MVRRVGAVLLGGLFAAGVAGGIGGPTPAHASRARRAALAGHPFVVDDTDVLRYPSAAPRSAGLLFASHGDDVGPLGEAGALVGEAVVLGVYLGGPDGGPDLARRADVFPGAGVVVPARLLDLALAFRPLPGHTLGVLLGAAHTLERTTNADAGDNGVLASSFAAGAAHSFDAQDGDVADTALRFDVSYFRRTERFEVTHEAPVGAAWEVTHRSLWTVGPRWQLGVAAALSRRPLDLRVPAAAREAKGAAWAFDGEVGPRFTPTDRVAVALSARFAWDAWAVGALDSPPRRADAGGETAVVLPGLRAALEARLADWLEVRLGFVGGRTSRSAHDGAGDEAVTTGRELAWTSGVGLRFEGLRLDGRLQAALLRDGPDMVGGTAPGLFSTVSATYVF